jgi:hypothetical protein
MTTPPLLEKKIPEITIDQRDNDRSAEENDSGADVIAPAKIHPVDPGCGIGREGQGEELEENPEGDSGTPLEQTPERKRQEKGQNEDRECFEPPLGVDQEKHVRTQRNNLDAGRQAPRLSAVARSRDKPNRQGSKGRRAA